MSYPGHHKLHITKPLTCMRQSQLEENFSKIQIKHTQRVVLGKLIAKKLFES